MEPLSEDARIILALIRKYLGIEPKHISLQIPIDIVRIMKAAQELSERYLVEIRYVKNMEKPYHNGRHIIKAQPAPNQTTKLFPIF